MKLIVQAADLGYSEAVNHGILKSVKDGIINNVSLMVNMPKANHGYNLLRKTNACIGLHVNISVGEPVSDITQIPSLIDGKKFKPSSTHRNSKEDFIVLKEAIYEVENQFHLFQSKFNKKPEYIDFHAVFSQNFIQAVRIVSEENNIPFIGMNLDGIPIDVNEQRIRTHVSSLEDSKKIFDWFKNIVNNKKDELIDLFIFHPGYIDLDLVESSSLIQQRIFDISFLTDLELIEYIKSKEISLTKFNEL